MVVFLEQKNIGYALKGIVPLSLENLLVLRASVRVDSFP
jgi:hypothetical protein